MNTKSTLLIFLMILSLLLVSCSSYEKKEYTTPTVKVESNSAPQPVPQPPALPEETKTSSSTSSLPSQVSVTIQSFKFSPSTLTIKVGSTVTWTNMDGAPHNIKSEDNTLDSPDLSRGQSWSFTFTNPGTYNYICGIHPSMKGSITVE
jgi:amicyanin